MFEFWRIVETDESWRHLKVGDRCGVKHTGLSGIVEEISEYGIMVRHSPTLLVGYDGDMLYKKSSTSKDAKKEGE